MSKENTEKIREHVLQLIDSEFESDAAFERAMGLSEKTVNNWRRSRSASFMRMLPALSEKFGVNISELFSLAPRKDTSELSEDEIHLLHLYRRSRILPQNMRSALRETLETTISLYISTAKEMKDKVAQKNKKTVSR
jgi:transcriptional regulator with XRE-family HTH domain